MYYTSNERDCFSLSADIFNYENKRECRREYTEMYFFYFYFLIVHISSNNVLDSLTCCIHIGNTNVEGTVSQIIFQVLLFILWQKMGNF